MYQHFCKIYDLATNKSKYPKWKDFTLGIAKENGLVPKSLFDVACGTCNNSILYAREGIKVVGLDQSPGMLEIARKKFEQLGVESELYIQSFYNINVATKCDLAICYDFSTNHILTPGLFVRFLNNVYRQLNDGGLFIFDIKPRQDWINKFSKYSDFKAVNDTYSYRWQVEFDKMDKDRINIEFVLRKFSRTGYKDYIEKNKERVYEMDEIKQIVGRSPFKLLGVYADFDQTEPTEESALWNFVLKKE